MSIVTQIFIFKVRQAEAAEGARAAAKAALRTYSGLVEYNTLTSVDNGETVFADHVVWADARSADAAGERFYADPATAALRDQITEVLIARRFGEVVAA